MNPDEAQEIEQAFLASWDSVEQYYLNTYFWGSPEWYRLHHYTPDDFSAELLETISQHLVKVEWLKPIQNFIAELRKRGYDRQLRAGHQMDSFIVSRARSHGLRLEQACIIFYILEVGMKICYGQNSETFYERDLPKVELTPEVEALIDRLLAQPID